MTRIVRRAGHLTEADGGLTVWSVATGRRGRRWRWTTSDPMGRAVSHTLETDPSGRFLGLESATCGVLLTLHGEPDGSIHGNRVSISGVDHLMFGPPAPGHVFVDVGALGAAAFLAGVGAIAEATSCEALVITEDLGITIDGVRIGPVGRRTVEVERGSGSLRVEVDDDGLPVGPLGADSWPLERF